MALRYKEIKQAILEEVLSSRPHVKLDSRPQMCQQYLVTRTTIDRAINELVQEGYLYSVNGSGTYVADFAANAADIRRDVRNIGVLLPNIMHDTYPGILRGIEDTMQRMGANVVLCNTDNDQQKQNSYLRRLLNSKVNGIIMIPTVNSSFLEDQELYIMLSSTDVPIVFCNRRVNGLDFPFVSSNDFYGGYIATRHLIQRGYRRIAYLSAVHYRVSFDRYQGYLSALWEAGMEPDERIVRMLSCKNSPESGYELMDDLLCRFGGIDAAVCFNDRIARGAIQAVKDHGLRVSDDIGIIGYDNTEACEIMPEKLTSVSYKTYEIGQKAAETSLRLLETPDCGVDRCTLFKPELCLRESCLGKAAVQNPTKEEENNT